MLAGPEGPASACLLASALLRVETIFGKKGEEGVVLCPTVGANCSCREQIRSVRHKCHLTYISVISSVGLFPSSRYRLGPGRGYLQKGLQSLRDSKALKKSNQVINEIMNAYL